MDGAWCKKTPKQITISERAQTSAIRIPGRRIRSSSSSSRSCKTSRYLRCVAEAALWRCQSPAPGSPHEITPQSVNKQCRTYPEAVQQVTQTPIYRSHRSVILITSFLLSKKKVQEAFFPPRMFWTVRIPGFLRLPRPPESVMYEKVLWLLTLHLHFQETMCLWYISFPSVFYVRTHRPHKFKRPLLKFCLTRCLSLNYIWLCKIAE